MHQDFEQAYERYLAGFSKTLTEEQHRAYREYALGNRQRGVATVKTIASLLGEGLAGMNCLDVGSGYGGLLLAMATEAASVVGIEYAKDLFDLSRLNVAGEEGNIEIHLGNILDADLILSNRKFDLITVGDVFEHIYEIDHLFKRLSMLSHDETVIYFEIPNHRSHHAIRKEHHKFIFGLTMLDVGSWAEMIGTFNIYHRPFSIYKLLFQSIGCNLITLALEKSKAAGVLDRVKKAHDEIDFEFNGAIFPSDRLKYQAKANFERLKRYLVEDTVSYDESELFSDYESYIWSGVATRVGTSVSPGYLTYSLS